MKLWYSLGFVLIIIVMTIFLFQGLNRLAAVALLFLNEEDAFWCLVAIVEYLLPQDYYSSSMVAAQTDQVR